MTRRITLILFLLFYLAGIVTFNTDSAIWFSFLLFIIFSLLIVKNVLSGSHALTFFLIFAFGFFNCSLRDKEGDYLSSIAPLNDVTLTGSVISLPSSFCDDATKFYLDVDSVSYFGKTKNINAKTAVTLSETKSVYKTIEIGDKLSLAGRLSLPREAGNPSEFSYAAYLKHNNVFSRFFVSKGNFLKLSKADKPGLIFLARLNSIRNKITQMHSANIPSPEAELLGGVIFGDDAVNPTPELKNAFLDSGLMHLIAASGMNVTMIFGMWFFISRKLRFHYISSLAVGILTVICYTCMTGFGPPVLRAALMLILILIGKMFNRKADTVNLLFFVAFLLLAISPSMIFNIGFQLSFAVTLGLLLFCPLLLDNIRNKFLSALASVCLVPIVAQVFAAPIQMYCFNTFSPYSVFANIIAVPVITFVSFIGFVSSVSALIKPVGMFCIRIADYILYPFLNFTVEVAEFFSSLPYSSVIVAAPSLFQLFVYYLAVFLLFACFVAHNNRKKYFASFLIAVVILLLSLINIRRPATEIIFFEVGNADAALIKTPENKYILIDTGKAPYKNYPTSAQRIIYKYFKDNGIKKLDFLILSHFDSDHSGGALFLLDEVKVDNLILREKDSKDTLAQRIYSAALSKKVNIIYPDSGDIPYKYKNIELKEFHSAVGDDNEKSSVILYSHGKHRVLFTGDTNCNILKKLNLNQKISLLKVPHHGAVNVLDEDFVSDIAPDAAVISTGFNIYGHPDKSILTLLKKHNVKILRTDKNHAVKAILQKNRILLYSYDIRKRKFVRVK